MTLAEGEGFMRIAARRPVATFTVIVLALGGAVVLLGLPRERTPFGRRPVPREAPAA